MSTSSLTREAPWHAGWKSAQLLFCPGLVLQTAALGLVLSYYYLPSAHHLFDQLARWRTEGGYVFSAVASAICGGLLPFLYLRATAVHPNAYPWSHLIFFTVFWAWKGAEVDLLYRSLAKLYGSGTGIGTILRKVVTDLFGYNVFYATPVGNLVFAWKDAGFRWAPVSKDVRAGRWYARSVFPVLISVWALWAPIVTCIYSLPSALQIPLFNIVLCFWSLLFAHITTHQQRGNA
ncbi:MAG TPA: hypothetical protein VGM64_08350 [Lacunisphaera sp.]|jgi:hypothetical protein